VHASERGTRRAKDAVVERRRLSGGRDAEFGGQNVAASRVLLECRAAPVQPGEEEHPLAVRFLAPRFEREQPVKVTQSERVLALPVVIGG